MKSTRVRVILAVAAAGVALTACSPNQAGAAAIVSGERISSAELDRDVREYEGALAKVGATPAQLQFPGSVPQVVLYQMVTAKKFVKAAERKGLTATEGEVDQLVARLGGMQKLEQQLLQVAVPPSRMREFLRAQVMVEKLAGGYGGGMDQASVDKGRPQAEKDAATVKVEWNPRYGQLNTAPSEQQPGLFVAGDRFSTQVKAPAAPVPPQQ
ncbi:SurA N-terminal domain-containing protein [Streptosporangium sp. NPDC023615]|uniref:SurA N-terminal domain-containing protein n=1 Tax=Streptosporangium sp. NPDC023615 TaxID=3154794 RepID=UPI00341F4CC8